MCVALPEQVTQHDIRWAGAICRGTKLYKVQVALEGETNVRFFPAFFPPIHRVISFSRCLVLEEQWVYLVPWPLGALGAGSELTKAERSICPGLSSCLSCALMALAAILGEVARFMLVKHGSVRLKGHVGGCCFVFHRDFQEGVSAPRKWTNMTESWSVCLSPCGDSTGVSK